jgi:hypothetical protein
MPIAIAPHTSVVCVRMSLTRARLAQRHGDEHDMALDVRAHEEG